MPDYCLSTNPDPAQWDRYVAEHPEGGVYLLQAWKKAVELSYRHKTSYLTVYGGNKICGVLPLVHIRLPLTKGRFVSLPFCDYGGCLADNEEVTKLLLEQSIVLSSQSAATLEIRIKCRNTLLERDNRFQQVTNKCRMELELPDSSAALWTGFKSKLRSQINRAIKESLISRLGHLDLLADFCHVFTHNMRDIGSPVHAGVWLRNVLSLYDNRAKVTVVYMKNQPLAAAIMLAHGQTLTVPWASSLRAFNRFSPNMLLYWSMLKYGAENGYQMFDFGRSTPGEGTYMFKQQWGAKPCPLYWYKHISHHTTATPQTALTGGGSLRRILEEAWRHIPLPVANTIGPLVRKYIDK